MKTGPRKGRRVTLDAGNFLRHAVKTAAREKFGVAGEQLVDAFDDFVQRYVDQKPEEPWWQLPDKCVTFSCSKSGVQLYQSHNGFVQCLLCHTVYKRPPLGQYTQTYVYDRTRDFRAERQQARQPPRQARQGPRARPQYAPPPDPHDAQIRKAYALLGLERGVTQEDIKRRRRELALQYHSDVSGADGKRMAEINAAVDLLLEQTK